MKKLFAILALVLMLTIMAMPAVAEGIAAVTPDMPTDFFTWATIGTFAGAVAMTVFIVQALKMPADKVFGHVPTRLIVYVIALALLLLSQAFLNGGLTVENTFLAIINAFLVMLAAMSTYTMLIEQTETRKYVNGIMVAMAEKETETDPPDEAAVKEE